MEARLGEQVCTNCHGDDLKGDAGQGSASCDTWRSDCTFCHGGEDNLTGAPPEDIHDAAIDASFGPHTAHVEGGIRTALECTECHVEPEGVLSIGHMFDATPGVAENDFSVGLRARCPVLCSGH